MSSKSPSGKKTNRILRRVIAAFHPYRRQLWILFLALVAGALLTVATALLIKVLLDEAIGNRNITQLIIYSSLMLLVPMAGSFITLMQSMLTARIVQGVVRDFQLRLYERFQRMSLRFYSNTRGGEIHSRLVSDVNGIQGVLTNTICDCVANLIICFGSLVAMIYISPALTIVAMAFLPLMTWVSLRVARMRRDLTRERQESLGCISSVLHETLSVSPIMLIKTFGREAYVREKFERATEAFAAVEIRLQSSAKWGRTIFAIILSAIPAAIYLVAGWQIIIGGTLLGVHMTVGALIAFTALQGRFFNLTGQTLAAQGDIQAAFAMFERIFEVVDLPEEIVDESTAKQVDFRTTRGEVSFKGVCFDYRNSSGATLGASESSAAQKPGTGKVSNTALENISFVIKPGRTTALVGRSGSGKTTIGYLLLRLYEPDQGVIAIDGLPLKQIRLDSLRGLVGVVSQEVHLMHASIRENLLFARPTASEDELFAAAAAASIHDRINELEHGYDTIVGERGYKLSTGEKQRIAIARAILKNPPILILDEATSALDVRSEKLVQDALDRLTLGRTTLIIAHRLSTIVAADQILVIDEGEIVERGTHAELLKAGGHYAQLYKTNRLGLDEVIV